MTSMLRRFRKESGELSMCQTAKETKTGVLSALRGDVLLQGT